MSASPQPYRADLAESERRRRDQRRRLTISIGAGVSMSLIALLVWAWTALMAGVPPLGTPAELWAINRAPGMTFIDGAGQVLATRGPKHGQRVPLAAMPAYLPKAFLAAEDRRFYRRRGALDLRGIGRAAHVDLKAGQKVQGASTIAQQLARTLFLTTDRTFKRKLQEAVVAQRLENKLGKDGVLELYLNRIFFGAGAYGVEAAAQTYFAKSARDLTLSEAALLAALPKAPTKLAPTNDLDAAIERSHLILAAMRDEGWISAADETAALASRPALAPRGSGEAAFGYLLDMAAAEVARLGVKAPDMTIKLSVDPLLQDQVQTILRRAVAEQGAPAGVGQGAVVVLAPDGAIKALAGGVDYRASPFNRAVQAKRQPGSAYKPFVYAAALEAGVAPDDIRPDAPFKAGGWQPENYDGVYRGDVTVKEALAQSLNTVAARLGAEVGRQKLGDLAHRFGLEDIPDNPELPVSLGAYELNLLELTSGYQVFQNAGGRTKPYLVESVISARGDPLYLRQVSPPVAVYDPARAGAMVRMMQGVIDHGTGTRAKIGRPAAGKTGTSQKWRDAWFIGFTPDFAAGVWVGNDDGRPMARVAGGALPAEIWRQVMTAALAKTPAHPFGWTAPPDLDAAARPLSDPRNQFYEALAADFAKAAAPPAPKR